MVMPLGTEWKRQKLLGRGGQAQVFLASTLTQSYSSCVLPPLIAVKSVDTIGCVPLMRENQIFEDLGGCRNIIEHHGVKLTLENGQLIYNILLEFAEVGSLLNQIQTYGVNGLPEMQVRGFTESVLLGLKHIHDRGYVHRDIKPETILICKDNIAKIADFGFSKKLKNPLKRGLRKNKLVLKGTPLYMAPESVIYGEYRSRCDVWAIGCVVLEMLTGKQAWNLPPQTELKTLLSYIASDTEYPLSPVWISDEARDFLIRCFSKNPRNRWTVDMLLRHPFIVQNGTKSSEIDDLPRPNFFTAKRRGKYDSRICGKRMQMATTDDDEEEVMESSPVVAQDCIRYWCTKRHRITLLDQSADDIPLGF